MEALLLVMVNHPEHRLSVTVMTRFRSEAGEGSEFRSKQRLSDIGRG